MDRHDYVESLRELWLSEGDLGWLDALDEQTLALLHSEVTEHTRRIDEAQGSVYRVMAGTTKFLPKFVVGKMAQGLDPYVVAQITRYLESKAAGAISKVFEPAFLGEVTLHLDAQKIAEIVRHTDMDVVTTVVEHMGDRGFHHRLGELADTLEPELLNKITHRLGDPERVADIAAEMNNQHNLVEVARSLKPKVLDRIVRVLERRGHETTATLMSAQRS